MSLTPLPPPGEKYIFFALPSMNGPLPAELKFRENTANTGYAAIHYINRGVSIASFLVQQNQLVASNNFITSDRGNSFSLLFLLL